MEPLMLFAGIYTRPDDLTAFEYEVTVTPTGDGTCAWVARVTSDGAIRGRPSGVLTGLLGMSTEAIELAIRDLVETSIRDRAAVG